MPDIYTIKILNRFYIGNMFYSKIFDQWELFGYSKGKNILGVHIIRIAIR